MAPNNRPLLPPGQSVNDGIDHMICSLTYTSVDEVHSSLNAMTPCSHLTKSARSWEYLLQRINGMDQQPA